jgi:hypothetical protein
VLETKIQNLTTRSLGSQPYPRCSQQGPPAAGGVRRRCMAAGGGAQAAREGDWAYQ